MVELAQKKVGKLIGLKKVDFNQLIRSKEISLSKPRLIPVFKLGDEMALTSVLLSTFRLVKEFKENIFSQAKLQKGGTLYVYTEVAFKDCPESRIDGLMIIVKAGTIRDAAILEMKNGKNPLEKEQIERYQQVAKRYAIPKFITISNQFVSDPTQSPLPTKTVRGVDMYHFSWTYLLTIAHVLLFKNDTNIEDEDQVEIMREVVGYFEHDKSGIVGVNQMSPSWTNVVEKINAGASLSASDENIYETVRTWHQEERDIALMLSRELGVLVSSGESKFKGKLEERLKDNSKDLVKTKQLSSILKVKGAASDIKISAMFEKRTVEMVVSLKPPTNMTYKGQLGWIKRQFDSCGKKDEAIFESLSKSIYLEVLIKSSSKSERFSLFQFDAAAEHLKNKEIREFRIVYLKDFGKGFASPKKFVVMIDSMLKNYYTGIVQHLVRWEPTAPKMTKEAVAIDDESFIGNPDSEGWVNSTEPTESLLTTVAKENRVEPAT